MWKCWKIWPNKICINDQNNNNKNNQAFFFFVRYCNICCVSLGRAHRLRVAVATRDSEGFVRKSCPRVAGRHCNHANQYRRDKEGPGWQPQEGCWVEEEGKSVWPLLPLPYITALIHPLSSTREGQPATSCPSSLLSAVLVVTWPYQRCRGGAAWWDGSYLEADRGHTVPLGGVHINTHKHPHPVTGKRHMHSPFSQEKWNN